MGKPRHRDIWWASLPSPAGRRPVLILTRDDAIAHLSNVTVAPLTRTIRHIKSEVILSPECGVPTLCAVSLDNILTMPRVTLDRRIVRLGDETMKAVFEAIRYAFAMPDE